MTPVSGGVIILAYRRAAHLDPRFKTLDTSGYCGHDARDIGTSMLSVERLKLRKVFWVAYIVEVNAIDVVLPGNLSAKRGKIVGSLLRLWIEIAVGLNFYQVVRHLLA